MGALDRAGLALVSMLEPARYDPMTYLPPAFADHAKALDPVQRMAVAEQLAGNIKTHISYAVPTARTRTEARPTKPDLIPHLSGMAPAALARQIDKGGAFSVTLDGHRFRLELPRDAAPLIARIGGRSLGEIAGGADWMAFQAGWGPIHRTLTGFNLLHYSIGARP